MASTINASTSSGIVQTADTSGVLQLQTASTTAVTVDASQNVGIGTTSPSSKLEVYSTSAGSGGNATYPGSIVINTGLTGLNNTGANGLEFKSSNYLAGYGQLISSINVPSGGTQLVFANRQSSATWTEMARFDNLGNLLVGTTTAQGQATFNTATGANWSTVSQASNATGNALGHFSYLSGQSPNNTLSHFYYGQDSTTLRFAVRSNGGIANFSANNVNLSDEREKKDIQLAGSYLDKICAIPVKTFLFNDQTDTDLNLGVIAQDVQAVAPELVTESNWGTQEEPKERLSIYQTDLQYALMKCIQEQQTIINDLKARIETLEGAK